MSTVPPGFSPPPYGNEPGDRSGWTVIASSTGLMLVLLFGCVRAYTRYPFRSRLLYDDLAIIVATALAVIQSVLVIVAASRGLGKTEALLFDGSEDAEKLLYASDILSVLALFGSRIAVLFLEHALSPERWHKLAVSIGLGAAASMAIAAAIMVGLGCDLATPWSQVESECGGLYLRWIVVFAFGVVLEVLIFAVVLRLLFAIQRDWTSKLKATIVFALRLPVLVIAAYRLLALRRFRQTSDPLLDRTFIVALTQAELAYSLMTAMIPSMMPFLTKLNTGLGALSRDDFIKQTQQESGGSFALRSLSKGGTQDASQSANQMRADNVGYKSVVVSHADKPCSISSDDSQKVMVRKTVDVNYS